LRMLLFIMTKITTAQFRKGITILFKNEPHLIISSQHVNPGKGSAFIRTKLKSIQTGKVLDFTFKSGESVEEIPVHTKEMQYLYKDSTIYHFMDNASFEQHSVSEKDMKLISQFLKEGETYQVFVHDDKILGLRQPKRVCLEVTDSPDAVKGDTTSSATKTITVESGLKIKVPLFIKRGDMIVINTETSEYVERK